MLDPQAHAYLETLRELAIPPYPELGVSEARRLIDEGAAALFGEPGAVHSIEEESADGVPVRIYRHEAETPALVYFHGGGWVIGSLDSHDRLCRTLAAGSGCAVVSVDYRLAPEHPYPAAVEDAWTATAWAAARFPRIAVGGDSAGGHLAALTALTARDRGVDLALQVLAYPVTDCNFDTDSYREHAEVTNLPAASMRWFWDMFLQDAGAEVAVGGVAAAGAEPRRCRTGARHGRRVRPAVRRGRGLRRGARRRGSPGHVPPLRRAGARVPAHARRARSRTGRDRRGRRCAARRAPRRALSEAHDGAHPGVPLTRELRGQLLEADLPRDEVVHGNRPVGAPAREPRQVGLRVDPAVDAARHPRLLAQQRPWADEHLAVDRDAAEHDELASHRERLERGEEGVLAADRLDRDVDAADRCQRLDRLVGVEQHRRTACGGELEVGRVGIDRRDRPRLGDPRSRDGVEADATDAPDGDDGTGLRARAR